MPREPRSRAGHIAAFLRPTAIVCAAFAMLAGLGLLAHNEPEAEELLAFPPAGTEGLVLPDPLLSPTEVVQLQVDGLAADRADGLGILQCYCFASPANRTVTGPLDRFGAMVRQGPFRGMARPRAVLVGSPQVTGEVARLLVTIVDEASQLRAFTFVLAKQKSAPYAGCWMTEAVFPVNNPPPPQPELPTAGAPTSA